MKTKKFFGILIAFVVCLQYLPVNAQTVWVEAESFTQKGGWIVDPQFMDQMGSPYLMAHGKGNPVVDASTTVQFASTGNYHVYVRTYNWTSPWTNAEGPGKFQIAINDVLLNTVLGSTGNTWMWQDAGTVQINSPSVKIDLHDLTGFNGRCDAIYFTKEATPPPASIAELTAFRYQQTQIVPQDAGTYDLVVVGGGIAGICTAVSASRLGLNVALIHNRNVWGGNNSSDVRVHLGGRVNINPYPQLGAIVNELSPVSGDNAGPAARYEDEKKKALIDAQPTLTPFLNLHAFAVEKEGNKITAVKAKQTETGAEYIFHAPLFVDCTGDGMIGVLAGATYLTRTEGKNEFNEPKAPASHQHLTMGSSVQWYATQRASAMPFPEFEYGITFNEQSVQKTTMGEWTWETGMDMDQVEEFERIRDYGMSVIYSNWSFLKNHSSVKDNYTKHELDWVAFIAGKRESKRLVGDLVLKEQDVRNQIEYPDATATTSWSIDLHYPMRVMRTTGMLGEVVGMAASICKAHQATPRDVYEQYLNELKALMIEGVGVDRNVVTTGPKYNEGEWYGNNWEVETYSRYVDPLVGTTFTGHTFPNATYPFGFMQPGPQTGNFEWKYCGGYRYEDSTIWGFSQNRLNGTGIPDLGDLLMMPFSGQPGDDYKSRFSHETEKAFPGYYSVSLIDNSVDVELSATPHVAIHRYTFQEDNPGLYINFQSAQVGGEEQYNTRVSLADVNVEDNQTISGHHTVWGWANPRQLYYVIQFDQPFISKEEIAKDERNKAPVTVFRFDGKSKAVLRVKVAISTVSVEGARKKIEAELTDWDFDRVKQSAENAWENLLSRIKIEGTVDQKKNFYTSLYHAFIQPHDIADLDGKYRGPNDSILVSPIGKYYSTFSLWDTFRAAHPLYTLIAPEQESDFVNSMLLHAENYGILPIWALWGKETYCMIGNHGTPPVVEACLKDLPGIDQEKAYQLVKQSLTGYNRKYDWAMYDQYGYFPFDLVPEESVSRTLECGYDDYCAAQLAKKLNKMDDYAFFMKRAAYYKNLFDPETKLVRGKDSHGQWRTPFDRFALSHAGTAGGDYTEGNAWQYTWHVPQDVDGLVELLGGKEAFVTKLDSLFVLEDRAESSGFTGDVTGLIGQYAHGNEPSHHVVYLYSLAGRNDRTAELVHEIFDRFYQPKPDGLCGNDDCGQMSAWYIFSALGFYPVNTVNGEYVLGAPQIPQATIQLADNKKFTVIANGLSKENKYVKSVTLNGVELKAPAITYHQIIEGGTLEFEMTDSKQ